MELTQDEIQQLRNWRIFQNKVKNFENKANIKLFEEIYGEDGCRLLINFRSRCQNDYLEFETFLTPEQLNTTLIFIMKRSF